MTPKKPLLSSSNAQNSPSPPLPHHQTHNPPTFHHQHLSGFLASSLSYFTFEHPSQIKSLKIPNIPLSQVMQSSAMGVLSRGVFGTCLFSSFAHLSQNPIDEHNQAQSVFLGALFGSLCGSFLSLPFEKERIVSMATMHGHSERWSLRRGKYRGLGYITAHHVLFYPMQFLVYHMMKEHLLSRGTLYDHNEYSARGHDGIINSERKRLHFGNRALDLGVGLVSGSLVALPVYPFDRFFSYNARQPFNERIPFRQFMQEHLRLDRMRGYVGRMGVISMVQWGMFESMQDWFRGMNAYEEDE